MGYIQRRSSRYAAAQQPKRGLLALKRPAFIIYHILARILQAITE